MGNMLKDSFLKMGLVCVGREEEVIHNKIKSMEERDKGGYDKMLAHLNCLK